MSFMRVPLHLPRIVPCIGVALAFVLACTGDDPIIPVESDSGVGADAGTDSGVEPNVRWVTSDGKQSNSGLTPKEGLNTIVGAITSLREAKFAHGEIRLCSSTEYRESGILLDIPVSIRGGFDCSSGKRTSTFGKAQSFVTVSKILPAKDADETDTLTVVGTAIDNATILDGLSIAGLKGGTKTRQTVLLRGGASPTIRDNIVIGAETAPASGAGSISVRIEDGAAFVTQNAIVGSASVSPNSVGALGIQIVGGKPRVQYNSIVMDGSAGPNGAWGIQVDGKTTDVTGDAALIGNTITLRNNKAQSAGGANPFIGIYGSTSNRVEVRSNHVNGSGAICTTAACVDYGMVFNGPVDIDGNTVVLDTVLTPQAAVPLVGSTAQSRGIQVYSAPNSRIVNNAIAVTRGAGVNYESRYTIGVVVGDSSTIDFAHNTVHILAYGPAGIGDGYAVWLDSTPGKGSSVALTNNILSSFEYAGGGAIEVTECHGNKLTKVAGNLFIGAKALVRFQSGDPATCPGLETPATVAALQSALQAHAIPSGDNRLAAESICAGGIARDACLAKVFGDLTLDTKPAAWFMPGAQPLASACTIVRSIQAVAVNPPLVDLLNVPRKGAPVAGAWTGACNGQ